MDQYRSGRVSPHPVWVHTGRVGFTHLGCGWGKLTYHKNRLDMYWGPICLRHLLTQSDPFATNICTKLAPMPSPSILLASIVDGANET